MFEPRSTSPGLTTNSSKAGTALHSGLPPRPSGVANVTSEGAMMEAVSYGYQQLLIPSLLIALSSSHAYILVRILIRHIIVRLAWKGSPEERQAVGADRQVKAIYLRSLKLGDSGKNATSAVSSGDNAEASFWARDDGNEELYSSIKEA